MARAGPGTLPLGAGDDRETACPCMCQHAGMSQDGVDVQCQRCLRISTLSGRGDIRWDCPCGYSYGLRRCSSCGVVSNVRSLQRRGEPWLCVWCKAANDGYTPHDDPATATLSDLAADMARHGLEYAHPRAAAGAGPRHPASPDRHHPTRYRATGSPRSTGTCSG
jgi:hypothetical protein